MTDTATIAMLATEALKTVPSMFIDALLGPKLQSIKNWAEKQEIKEKLESHVINDLFDEYFKRLLRRVSGLTTIVVPQRVLHLNEVYEPLKMMANQKEKYDSKQIKNHRASQKPFEFTAEDLETDNNYLIIDTAGTGKSTFAKHLVLDILGSTHKIPLFLELRKIEESETLLERLSKEIDESQEYINKKTLTALLNQGNYVIVLDGYDEISEQEREKVGAQITDITIQFDKNILVLTTRPEVNLPDIVKTSILNIQPLTRKQAESLVLRYDKVADTNVGQGLISQFDIVSPEYLKTPLLVILLYRTYSYNLSIATKVTSFYDDVFNAFYKGHDLSKSGFSRQKLCNLDVEEFRRLLRGFSFLLLAHQKYSLGSQSEVCKFIEEAIKLTSVKPTNTILFFEDLLLAVPFLIRDGSDFRFIHKSLGEFFAAEFLAFSPNSEKTTKKIIDSHLYNSFIQPFEFLAELSPSLFRRLVIAPLAKSIIAEKNPIPNIFIRTICFNHDMYLARHPRTTSRTSLSILSRKIPNDGRPAQIDIGLNMRIKINRGNNVLSLIGRRKSKRIPLAAWRLITKIIKNSDLPKNITNPTFKFKDDGRFERIIIPGKWMSLHSKGLMKIVDTSPIIFFIVMLLNQLDRNNDDGVRVLDVDACKELLKLIQEERKKQKWLDAFITEI